MIKYYDKIEFTSTENVILAFHDTETELFNDGSNIIE
jgi:hypothetical protein